MSDKSKTNGKPENSSKTEAVKDNAAEVKKREKVKSDYEAQQSERIKLLCERFTGEEAKKIGAWYDMAALAYDYVSADLAFNGNNRKSYEASTKRLKDKLSEYDADSRSTVSRLIATHGLYTIMRAEMDDCEEGECDKVMKSLTTSQLFCLVTLIRRDKDTSDLSYSWRDAAAEKGAQLVCDAADGGYTIVTLKEAVASILSPSGNATGANGKAKSPLGKKALKTDELVAAVGKDAEARAAIVRGLTPQEIVKTIESWMDDAKRRKDIVWLFGALQDVKAKYRAASEARKKGKTEAQPAAA